MIKARPHTAEGLWFLILAGTLWGTGGLTGSLLARTTGLTSPAVAACRLGTGGLLLIAFLLVTRAKFPRGRRAWTRIVIIGLLAAEFQATYFAAVERISVSLATLITIGASPVLVQLVERRRALVTIAIALSGLMLLIGVPEGDRSLPTMLAGAGFSLLAAGGFATVTLVGSRPVPGLDDLPATGLAFTLGSLVLVPLATASGGLAFTPTWSGLGLLLLLGVGPTAIAYAAYFRGLRTSRPGTAALMALLEPLVGTALAVVILGDRLGPAGWAGAALLIIALVRESRSPETDRLSPAARVT
jgi:DME family drug/metabolite transporter